MHAMPLITDVLDHICELVDPASLSIMARTARVLHEPAIHALWHELPGLIPLLRCFPADSWAIEGDEFKFSRVLRPKDWTAVLKYSPLVRHFVASTHSAFCARPADAAVWETMCCLRPTATLFPQLRSLRWGDIQLPDKCLPSFLVCIGSGLTRVDLGGLATIAGSAPDVLQAIFDIMAERFPLLRALDVGHVRSGSEVLTRELGGSLPPTLPFTLTPLVSFASLKMSITLDALLNLTRLKTLRVIDVRLLDDPQLPSADEKPSSNTITPILSHLSQIDIHTTSRAYLGFSKTVTLPHTTTLRLRLSPLDSQTYLIPELLQSIHEQCSPDVLKHVVLEHYTNHHERVGPILPAHLRPLLEFKQLEVVIVAFRCRYALDDEIYTDMAKAWPLLERLWVGCHPVCTHEILPTVRALPPFAMHCPKLEMLGLVFDARHWEAKAAFDADDMDAEMELYGALARKASTSVLSRFIVGNSPIAVPEYVAAFLDRIFPALGEVVTERAVRDQWVAVKRFLPLFKHVRKDERLRVSQELSATGGGKPFGGIVVPW
ncbi:hypothetical protein VTO73DRAFT_5591 [Trametes versicolor]